MVLKLKIEIPRMNYDLKTAVDGKVDDIQSIYWDLIALEREI